MVKFRTYEDRYRKTLQLMVNNDTPLWGNIKKGKGKEGLKLAQIDANIKIIHVYTIHEATFGRL